LGQFLGVLFGIGGGCVLLFSLLIVLLGRTAAARRICAACAAGMGMFMSGIAFVSLIPQLDAVDSLADMKLPTVGMLLSILVALCYGFIINQLVPADPWQPAIEPVLPDAPRSDSLANTNYVWLQTVTGGTGTTLGVFMAVFIAVLGIVLGAVLHSVLLVALLVPTGIAVLLLVYGCSQFTVQIDATGLRARSKLGWPKLVIPANEVLATEAVPTTGMLDFGGYGYRINLKGDTGIITRDGAALKVRQTGGRTTYISVDDAARGAALLNSYADRARTTA
jgi:hypothetical protein